VILPLEEYNAKVKSLQAAYEATVDLYNAKAEVYHLAQKEADAAFDVMDAAYHAWMDAMQARNAAVDAHFAETRGEA
jgi:uncharacterized protein YqfA (UPF0365 family)